MYIGADEGCQEVPDPIPPIDIRFVWLAPTRILISRSVITNSGPIFIPPMPMPGICAIGLAEGLAPDIGMFIPGIFIPGIFMPGMFAMLCFFAGFLFLVEVLLLFGVDERWRFDPTAGDFFFAGIFMPGICCALT